jgi:DNA-binding XRE family transcriptional regulator
MRRGRALEGGRLLLVCSISGPMGFRFDKHLVSSRCFQIGFATRMRRMPANPSLYPLFRRVMRALRRQRGWTQEQLAEKAHSDYKHLQLLELGRTGTPSLELVARLARALGTKPWILLCDDIPLIARRTGLSPKALAAAGRLRPGRPQRRPEE